MNKENYIRTILAGKAFTPTCLQSEAFAPSNIALIKYWGKRQQALNLPNTSSLSISLVSQGTITHIKQIESKTDKIIFNHQEIDCEHTLAQPIIHYINLFRKDYFPKLEIKTMNNIPTAAGLASSASGYAALIQALDHLYGWQLSKTKLSLLARLGSGSACRSFWSGFVVWEKGQREDGMDSHGVPLNIQWSDLCIGILTVSEQSKFISSRQAMNITTHSSYLYQAWETQVKHDLGKMLNAIQEKNFVLLGETAEHNALAMHATMIASQPSILYWQPETLHFIQLIWQLRKEGLAVYFTEDAGPNLKLLFQESDQDKILQYFPQVKIIKVFNKKS